MDPAAQPPVWMQLIPLLIISVVYGFVIRALAIDKGRNVAKWTVLGFIPFVNFFFGAFAWGAVDLRLHRKIDAMLTAQGRNPDDLR